MRHKFWALLALCFITFFSFYGFDWGIVNPARLEALKLEETPHLLDEVVELTKTRGYQVNLHVTGNEDGQDLPYTNSVVRIQWDKNRDQFLRIYRHFLAWSYSGDAATALGPLSTMNPRRFNFNPHSFQYGGAFLYPLGLTLQLSSWAHYSHVVADGTYYIAHPLELRKLILAGRAMVVFMHILTIILIYKTATLWKGQWVGILSVILFLFLPGPLCLARELKPHAYALAWVMLSVYFGLRYLREGRDLHWMIASIGAGLAAGSVPNYGIAVLNPLLAICGGASDKKIKNILVSLFITGLVLLVTNPYAVLSYPILIQEMTVLKGVFVNSGTPPTPWSNMFAIGMPWWLSFAAGLSFLILLFNDDQRSEKIFMLALPVVYIPSFYWASHGMCTTRFALILYPSLTMFIAAGIFRIGQLKREAGIALAVLLIGLSTLQGTACAINYRLDSIGDSPIFQAGRFLDTLTPGTQVGCISIPGPGTFPAIPFHRFNVITLPTLESLATTPEKDLPTYLILANTFVPEVPHYTLEKNFLPFSFGPRHFFQPDPSISVGSPAFEIRIYRKTL